MGQRVLIIGAGPGGLTAGMLLAARGYQVEIFEKADCVGGRNAAMHIGPYKFDTGPTFLMMTRALEELFADASRDIKEYLDLRKLDPLYRLRFPGGVDFFPTDDEARMLREVERVFPGQSEAYRRYRQQESRKLDVVYPCLRTPYMMLTSYLSRNLLRALPHLDAFTSVYNRLASYFDAEHLRIAMTFQAKYLGMSPWKCPATFTILSLIEHRYGIYHPIGGLNAISTAMAKVIGELGGQIHLNTPVKQILSQKRKATGLLLTSGQEVHGDAVIINPDFAWAMQNLLKPQDRRTYTDRKLSSYEYSCSTFMLYLGLNKQYDIPHHNVFFADDYKANVLDITQNMRLSADPSFYVQNAVVTDDTLAPPGHSSIYVLVPVPNQTSGIDWAKEAGPFRDLMIKRIQERTELKDLSQHIVAERIISPMQWQQDHSIYAGATFNLAHTLGQMLYFRPHNRSEELANAYIVGGGTHPGSGLPTIYQSGRIAADLIVRDLPKSEPRPPRRRAAMEGFEPRVTP